MPPLSLQSRLARAFPVSLSLNLHHIVSEPVSCPELFPAPPDEAPEPTTCESHFLSASILHNGAPLQVFALEVLVYTTDKLTTLFVSKADSTGYLYLLGVSKGSPSPIKTVITAFLDYLVENKKREDVRLVLSLFARAQNQYLFPGSVDNSGKHVLDDRSLIRWWCRIIDPIISQYPHSETPRVPQSASKPESRAREGDFTPHAHLVVPGCDIYETRAFFPRNSQSATDGSLRWAAKDPLQSLGKPAGLSPRCYIPRFPDDPKARFVTDLDAELPIENLPNADDPPLGRSNGQWRSVRSMAQFWDFMAFRQECAGGRLVGFIWAVFEPPQLGSETPKTQLIGNVDSQERNEDSQLPTPNDSQILGIPSVTTPELPPSPALEPIPDSLLSPLPSSQPDPASRLSLPKAAFTSQKFEDGILLSESAYKRVVLLLETLDYASLDVALISTRSFLDAANKEVSLEDPLWGLEIVGEKVAKLRIVEQDSSHRLDASSDATVSVAEQASDEPTKKVVEQANVLGAGLIRKKKRPAEELESSKNQAGQSGSEPRMLGSSLVRKKPKV